MCAISVKQLRLWFLSTDSRIFEYTNLNAKFCCLKMTNLCIHGKKILVSFDFLTNIHYKMTRRYLQIGNFLYVWQINLPPGGCICPTNSPLQIYKCQNFAKYLQQFAKMRTNVYVAPNMRTISLCKQESPYANILAIPAHMHTGIPICVRQSPYA